MKRSIKIISMIFVLVMLIASVPFVFSADSFSGWRVDEDGVERYYRDGKYVTGACEINGFPYEFSDNGEYIGVYDGHVGVGVINVPETDAYKNAMKTLGSANIRCYSTMEQGESYKSADYTSGQLWEYGAMNPDASQSLVSGNVYTKNDAYTSIKGKTYLTCVQRYTSAEIVKRGEQGGALYVKGTEVGGRESLHTYLSAITATAVMGEETVIEGEFKLDAEFCSDNALLQLIDRKNANTGGNAFHAVLKINSEGGVYLDNDKNQLICVLNRNEYTRISVSIHPSKNTVDVYVNGILVKSGATYIAPSYEYKADKFQIDEVRLTQINKLNGGGMYVDNVAVYKAPMPICTVTEGAKNGVYLEGGVLRYYENNSIAIGIREVSGEFCGIKYDRERINFGTVNGDGGVEVGANATVKVNGAVVSTEKAGGNIFVAPDKTDVDTGVFGGWLVTDVGGSVLIAPKQIYRMTGDIVCEPLAVGFLMLDGASVRTAEDGTDIRFMAKLSREDYETLTSSGATVKAHMLIAPTEYFEKTYGYYTVEALKQAGYSDYTDVTVDGWHSENGENYYFAGATDKILPEDYAKEYSGVAYLEITYANGSTIEVYSEYCLEENSRSVYRIAHAAYNDRTTQKNVSAYPNAVKYNGRRSYSPYDDAKRAIIKSFADRVIVLTSEKADVKAAGAFYDAPYTVSNSFNASTGRTEVTVSPSSGWSVAEVCAVEVDGEKLAKNEYSIAENCSFSVDRAGTEFSSLKCEIEETDTTVFMDAAKDYEMFSSFQLNTDKQFCKTGESFSAAWHFSESMSAENAPLNGKWIGDYKAYFDKTDGRFYYDLSDIKTLTFSVYSTQSATVQFNAYSENPTSDGIDYYGKMLTLAEGWNNFTVQIGSMSFSRSPLGWDKITSIYFAATGWDQSNSAETVLYISDIVAHDRVIEPNGFDIPELQNAAVFAVGGYYSAVNGVKYQASLSDTESVAVMKDGVYYVPIAPVADANGMTGAYYAESDTLYAEWGGSHYVYTVGSRVYEAAGKKAELKYAPIESGDAILFSVQDVMEIFGYGQTYTDRMGLIVLSDTPDIYDPEADYNKIYSIIEECIYVRPTGDKIVNDLMATSGGNHPYLMIDQYGFEKLRYYYKMDATFRRYFDNLEKSYSPESSNFKAATTDFLLTDGMRLTRGVKDKTIYWAFFAKFYETVDPELSEKYAERCWIEVESGCNFTDEGRGVKSWNPFHYLDTAEMAYPIAIAYDWLYDYWVKTNADVKTEYNADNSKSGKNYNYDGTETRLSVMEDALYWLGLATTGILQSDTTGEYVSYGYGLHNATNNWNAVCTGGTIAAGLALAGVERYAENVKTFLEYAVGAIESGMWVYAPDGGYEEGPGYWTYGTTYLHVFLSCIDTACGTNYGVYNAPGFAHSVYFTTYLGTKNTTWGFHDGGSGSADTGIAPWFAMKAQDANVNAIRRQAIENGWKASCFYDVLYFDPHLCSPTITLQTDAWYSLDDIMTFRTSWDADNCIFAGLHGGDNTASHGDLDIGNFIINANGTFMICDLGSDAYNTDGYFGSNRWSFYRKRAEGQNTLVMRPHGTSWDGTTGNPHTGVKPITDQITSAISRVQRFESAENCALGVVEMAPAYAEMTVGVRGLYMDKKSNTVIIQDESVFSQAMDIWWFAHTEGNITVSEDGRSAVIERNGVYLYAEIASVNSETARFTVMSADSLDKRYVGDTDANDGYIKDNVEKSRAAITKLCVAVENVTELRLAVAFTVIPDPEAAAEVGTIYSWKNIDDWSVE